MTDRERKLYNHYTQLANHFKSTIEDTDELNETLHILHNDFLTAVDNKNPIH